MKFPKEITRTLKEFAYFDPSDMGEAVAVLEERGSKMMILAGGTDLLNQMKVRQVTPEFVLNIKKIKELEYISQNKGLQIGALTTITAIRESEAIKKGYISLYEATEWFGTPQIRNMATLGGNICRSSPSSDMVAPLMAFDHRAGNFFPSQELLCFFGSKHLIPYSAENDPNLLTLAILHGYSNSTTDLCQICRGPFQFLKGRT